ncbi:glycosyltransferase [Photorhabdus khanii]|uniref:Glycosyl transferase n=1 Tax=Photorhabdus khanii subsp. guanajuatensis TaxID=2100166 RepID=A0A4R4K0F0_9GAMM|nr:glycosyltransferase [Photorhabdus khanii]TDB60658.1 glycosyl transferase [Photorhabdus khanii subsp. guanajuatensis]
MKITLVITGLGMGGAERQVCNLADQFIQIGHQVLLISLTGTALNLPTNPAIKVKQLGMRKTPWSFLRAYWQAYKIIADFKPDVVHSHMVHANLFTRLLRLSARIPRLISTAHSTNEGGKWRMLAYRWTDHLADLTTNVSKEAVQAFIEQNAVRNSRIVILHNGINTKRFYFDVKARIEKRAELELDKDIPLLLAVGRLTEAKDYSNLLRAFANLNYQDPPPHLAIIGVGKLESKLKQLTDELAISTRVHWLGLRHDVAEWMSAADFYVMSSAWEGMPLVICEAMSSELVVIATDCGGVKDTIGSSGMLVPINNSSALTDAINHALRLTIDERKTLGKKARERILKHYSLNLATKSWLKLYQDKKIDI